MIFDRVIIQYVNAYKSANPSASDDEVADKLNEFFSYSEVNSRTTRIIMSWFTQAKGGEAFVPFLVDSCTYRPYNTIFKVRKDNQPLISLWKDFCFLVGMPCHLKKWGSSSSLVFREFFPEYQEFPLKECLEYYYPEIASWILDKNTSVKNLRSRDRVRATLNIPFDMSAYRFDMSNFDVLTQELKTRISNTYPKALPETFSFELTGPYHSRKVVFSTK